MTGSNCARCRAVSARRVLLRKLGASLRWTPVQLCGRCITEANATGYSAVYEVSSDGLGRPAVAAPRQLPITAEEFEEGLA